MQRRLVGTGVATSAVGFGCAGLFRIPQRNARRLTLDAVFDAGIRHFDVAPMYGLGLAEAELGSFLRRHRTDVTVTTKFGIEPTFISKGIAQVQRPMRAYLAKRPGVSEELKVAGKGPRSGSFGRLLYASPGYHRQSAQTGLERSLKALETDYIDIFLLHDPIGDLILEAPSLIEYLDEQCRSGRIRCWGVTGESSQLSGIMRVLGHAPVIQFQDDIFDRPLTDDYLSNGAWITYGALARALPLLRRFLAQSVDSSRVWSERLQMDLAEEATLPKMLLSAALRRNLAGPVLFSTTRAERARVAVDAASRSAELSAAELTEISEFAAAARRASTKIMEAS